MNGPASTSASLLPASPAGADIRRRFLDDERDSVVRLAAAAATTADERATVAARARTWVEGVRARSHGLPGIESFLQQYDLATHEGVLLMCVAEALLRIPDVTTADALIRDKLSRGNWERHLGGSDSLFVNASTWGLMLTGKLTRIEPADARDPAAWYQRLVARAGEPVVRVAIRQAMRVMAEQFVMGRTIEEALERSGSGANAGYRYSYDMLGESAITLHDAGRYRESYHAAIAAIGAHAMQMPSDVYARPSISVKLSALHPRYEFMQRARVFDELLPVIVDLGQHARALGIGLTIDAEEAERLEISLELFARARRDAALRDWNGLGLAVQAYQKRAQAVIAWLSELARATAHRIPVRLVKGAYWDTEIKRAQTQGLAGYPVFTRKMYTDVSYLACARGMLEAGTLLYPMFATHNAHTIAWVGERAAALNVAEFEFQRLHGMGEALYGRVTATQAQRDPYPCRVYAPVGSHQDLLPYLVRRLLENGANTSFVNRIVDPAVSIDDVLADPLERAIAAAFAPSTRIPLPSELFAPLRRNSAGFSLADQGEMAALDAAFTRSRDKQWRAMPTLGFSATTSIGRPTYDPAYRDRMIGSVVDADAAVVDRALHALTLAQPAWDALGGDARAAILERAADLIEADRDDFVVLLAREAGKTRAAGLAEVREAADFCRYYAVQARAQFGAPMELRAPTGEANTLALHGRGAFACISPWNFPLAIFVGQVAAALAAGNTVAAKPAEQTPLTAAQAVRCLHGAGVPQDVLALLPGEGETVGAALVGDARVAGVAFTGSTEVASRIAQTLARRQPIVPLIAETGGQNAMLVDSSALAEQVVQDALASAFDSAGQRCSALRILCVQDAIAPRVLELVEGAMRELRIGDPADLATDVGPVIDVAARDALEAHVAAMQSVGLVRARLALPSACARGTFVAPTLIMLDRADRLTREVFGPVMHVVTWRTGEIDAMVDTINRFGYGLTLGVHSRIDATIARVIARARVGNVYVNRNIIGAVVGVQPFGGEGLSGTGPKAGGPHYLLRFALERTLSVNTAAAGGNAALLSQADS